MLARFEQFHKFISHEQFEKLAKNCCIRPAKLANDSLHLRDTTLTTQFTSHPPMLGMRSATQCDHYDVSQRTSYAPNPVSFGQLVSRTAQENWCWQLWCTSHLHN